MVVAGAKVTVARPGVVYGLGAKLMALGARPKILPAVVKVPVKPAMAAWRGASAAAGVAAVIWVPAPTFRIVLVGLLMVLLPTGLP